MNLPLLSIIIFLPLVGGTLILLMNVQNASYQKNALTVGLITSFTTFAVSCFLLNQFDVNSSDFQFVEKYTWVLGFNSSYHVGVDGISILLVILSTLLTPLALLMGWGQHKQYARSYVFCFLILETMMVGTFCALDAILFYMFFEGVLIPMFLIIGIWGGANRIYASLKFFLYTLLGSVVMLMAIITMAVQTGISDIPVLLNFNFTSSTQVWLWLAFFASFAVKIPMWPFHTWLPDAHVEAPTAGSVILAGVLLKMGGYGFLRFLLPMFPAASMIMADFVLALSIVAVIYTSLAALVQKDMKKLIAYSSVAHMGFVTFGAFSMTLQGVQGALFQMLSHGIVSSALFMCVGVLYERHHSRNIADYGGLAKQMPYFAGVFMVFTFASAGLPVTSGFIGEILVMIAAFGINGWMAGLMGLGTILSAAYGLHLYRRVMFGKLDNAALKNLPDLTITEKAVFMPLVILTLYFGVCPQFILDITEPPLQRIVTKYKASTLNRLPDDQTSGSAVKETI